MKRRILAQQRRVKVAAVVRRPLPATQHGGGFHSLDLQLGPTAADIVVSLPLVDRDMVVIEDEMLMLQGEMKRGMELDTT